jgi:predicted RNA methylase
MLGSVFVNRCGVHSGATPLVVDVGAGFGFSSVHAAVSGCRVLAVESRPKAAALLRANTALNEVRDVILPKTPLPRCLNTTLTGR